MYMSDLENCNMWVALSFLVVKSAISYRKLWFGCILSEWCAKVWAELSCLCNSVFITLTLETPWWPHICHFIHLFVYFFVPLQLALEDPVHSVSLQQFVYEKLKAQQALMGDQGFGVLMETVDTELVRQLQEFLQGLWITCTVLCYLRQISLPNSTLSMIFEHVLGRLTSDH